MTKKDLIVMNEKIKEMRIQNSLGNMMAQGDGYSAEFPQLSERNVEQKLESEKFGSAPTHKKPMTSPTFANLKTFSPTETFTNNFIIKQI
jgi:hypothetical protein